MYAGAVGILNGGLRGGGRGAGYAKAAGLMSTIMGVSLRLNYVRPPCLSAWVPKLSPNHTRTESAQAPL